MNIFSDTVKQLEVSAFWRFGQNIQFSSFLTFSLLYQDMLRFSDKKVEEIGYI